MEESQKTKFVDFVVISGVNFPYFSRRYLIGLVKDIVKKHSAKFIVLAGNTIDGKYLEAQLKHRIQEEKDVVKHFNETAERGKRIKFTNKDAEEIKDGLIEEMALSLNDFLPDMEVNYHIVIAEKIYDRPIGVAILKRLRELRDDIRLINDPEAKIPINMEGIEEPRVIVPQKQLWFYKIISGPMQRLIDSFAQRTFSPRPPLILVGCSGTRIDIPFYKNVYCSSVQTLHKINEQRSIESMVGCVVINIKINKDGKPVTTPKTYDFRSVVFNEREFATANNVSDEEKKIIGALKPSSASFKTILFRINHRQKIIDEKKIYELLERLINRKIIILDKESNRYSVSESLVKEANITLEDFLKGSRTIKHVVLSCVHIGALKTLYFTAIKNLPKLALDADAIIFNGDMIQGLAHNGEYTGETLPIAFGYDKQEILAAHIVNKILWKIFEKRYIKINDKKFKIGELIDLCLIKLIINLGNHDLWERYSKNSIPLSLFESQLKKLLIENILHFCGKNGLSDGIEDAVKIIEERIIRVGEDKIVSVDNINIGLKHPHKPRTLSKSHRLQEVASYFSEQKSNNKDPSLVYVANFHEAASAHISIFGKTYLAVMTGAYLKDTQFEVDKDKVVDFGAAKVTITFNEKKEIIFSEVEFDSTINKLDERIVSADKLSTEDILKLCQRLSKVVNMPWRMK
jgi:hypothetical protein